MTRQSSKPSSAKQAAAAKARTRRAGKAASVAASVDEAAPPPQDAPGVGTQRTASEVHSLPESERIPDVPNTYADAVLDVVFGIYTSKVLLGFETGSGNSKPVGVVTMPTEALVTACMKILENLAAPGMGRQIVTRHANFARTLQHLEASIEMVEPEQKH